MNQLLKFIFLCVNCQISIFIYVLKSREKRKLICSFLHYFIIIHKIYLVFTLMFDIIWVSNTWNWCDAMIVEKYILYGASFNPPHVGHFSAISQMLEEYDKVFVFPYPKKYSNGAIEALPPINQRMKMLQIFFAEFFPQVHDRLILVDLAGALKKEQGDKVFHTYDYLEFAKTRLPKNAHLSVCLGFDAQNLLRKENFHNRSEIEQKYGVFELEEENNIKSEDLRQFFSSHKNLASAKHEQYIRYAVGNALAQHIFEHNLYGIKKKVLKPKENKEESLQEEKTTKVIKKKM